jgi:hypothetical protein
LKERPFVRAVALYRITGGVATALRLKLLLI